MEDARREFPEHGYFEIEETEYDSLVEHNRFQTVSRPKQSPNPKIDHVEQPSPLLPVRIGSGLPVNWSRMNLLLGRLARLAAKDGQVRLPPLRTSSGNDANEGSRVVDIGFDLDSRRRALYISSATKPKPRRTRELYSE